MSSSFKSSTYASSRSNWRFSARYETRPWRWSRAIAWFRISSKVMVALPDGSMVRVDGQALTPPPNWRGDCVPQLAPPAWRGASRAQHPGAALSSLQQGAHVRDGVRIAFQAVHVLFGFQFYLQPDAVRIMEVEGLAIPPFDNLGNGYPMVLEPLIGGVKFLRRVNRQGQVVHVLALALRRELGTIEHREGIAAADLDVVMPAPI